MEYWSYLYECFDGLVCVEEWFNVVYSFSVGYLKCGGDVKFGSVFVFLFIICVGGVGLNFIGVDIVSIFLVLRFWYVFSLESIVEEFLDFFRVIVKLYRFFFMLIMFWRELSDKFRLIMFGSCFWELDV